MEVAVFGGGCFWCTEAVYQELKGVNSVLPGYAGGKTENPTYEQVCTGETGHAEVIKIEFDPEVVKYHDLLNVFFGTHDPTTLNRQGNDIGTQYRSVIFYSTDEQKKEAERFIKILNDDNTFGKKIVTTLEELKKFYEAEDYHKQYYKNNRGKPYCEFVISPKVQKLRENFSRLLKK